MDKLYIDGGEKSGSGTIVRYASAVSALTGRELHLTNIRAGRKKPGLRHQHLKAVEAVRDICEGSLEGGEVGSMEMLLRPGARIRGGSYRYDIGTSGSATMLALTILPLLCFADKPSTVSISGGTFQDYAPSAHHLQNVLVPVINKMGVRVEMEILRPGYVPRGGGEIKLRVIPVGFGGKIKPILMKEQGEIEKIEGIALSSHLEERKVSERMSQACRKVLDKKQYKHNIKEVYDESAYQPGAALDIWARKDTGCIIGANRAGQPRLPSEKIGRFVARQLIEDLGYGSTVDRYTADQLVIFAALASGTSSYIIPGVTEHLDTNLWLVEEMLGVKADLEDGLLSINGIGLGK